MDLKRLRYFCRVVEQGSISQAAKVLNMAQPPLSKRIQELEDELKTPLFLRHGNRIEPTEAGFFFTVKPAKFCVRWKIPRAKRWKSHKKTGCSSVLG